MSEASAATGWIVSFTLKQPLIDSTRESQALCERVPTECGEFDNRLKKLTSLHVQA